MALGAPAWAQDTQSRHVSIEAQATVTHDDNVARSSEAVANARGLSKGDTIISPSLVADIYLPVSRQAVFLAGSVGWDEYQKNDLLSSSRARVDAGANLHLAFCQGVARTGYGRGQSDLQDLTGVVRNIETTTSIGLTMNCGRATGFAPTFGISQNTGSNSNAILHPSDYRSTSFEYGLGYRRPTLGTITLYGRHDETTYRHRLILVGTDLVEDGYETDAGGVRYERRLGARISGQVELGYTKVKPDISTLAGFKGTTYSAAIDYRVNSRFNTHLSVSRGVNATIRQGAAYAVDQTTQLSGTYRVGSRLNLNGGVSSGTSQYKGVGLGLGNLTKEDIKSIYGGARWDLGRRLALSSTFRHDDRNSNLPGFDYTDNQISASVIGKF